VYSDGRSEFRVSVIDPWQFRIDVTQQDGSVVLELVGQHECVWRWLGTQNARSPESCSKKTASKRYTPFRTSRASPMTYSKLGAITQAKKSEDKMAMFNVMSASGGSATSRDTYLNHKPTLADKTPGSRLASCNAYSSGRSAPRRLCGSSAPVSSQAPSGNTRSTF